MALFGYSAIRNYLNTFHRSEGAEGTTDLVEMPHHFCSGISCPCSFHIGALVIGGIAPELLDYLRTL